MSNYEQYFTATTESMKKLSPRETIQDANYDLEEEEEEEVHEDTVEIDWENLNSCRAALVENNEKTFSHKVAIKSSPASHESKLSKANECMLFVQNLPPTITAKQLYKFLHAQFPSPEQGKTCDDATISVLYMY